MNHIRITVVVCFALAAAPLATFAQPEAQKQPSVDKTKVTRLEQEIKVLRQMNDSNLALIEKLMVQSRENTAMLATVRSQTESQNKQLTVLESDKTIWKDIAPIAIALVSVFISILAWRINKQIAWFTGSMETHSTKTLMLKAKEQGISLEWWDPLINGPRKKWGPTTETAKHDEEIDLTTIYFGLPVEKRTKHSCFARLKVWWESTWGWITVCVKGSSVKKQPSSKPQEVRNQPDQSADMDPKN